MFDRGDTIAAISTPHGVGGIAVIRISGPEAFDVAAGCFTPFRVPFPARPKDICVGKIISSEGTFVDEAVCILFKGPGSFTGEDVAELQCHGGTAVARAVLSAAIERGARHARRGEFSRRALANGKMSLMKAESVLAMISAKTDRARLMASQMVEGRASDEVQEIKNKIVERLARMEAALDWPDEMSDEGQDDASSGISNIVNQIEGMLREAGRGRVLTEGLSVAIVGRPNMGKSSLMNRLLGRDRAIVSDIPGTTRDTVEDTANVEGIPIRFADTAGIGPSEDPLVAAGIQRTRQAASASSVVLYVAAYPEGLTPEDEEEIKKLSGKRLIVVLNKVDLLPQGKASAIKQSPAPVCQNTVAISAKTGCGLENLKSAIASEAGKITEFEDESGPYSRWMSCLEGCLMCVKSAGAAIDSGLPTEAACTDLRDALYNIGELTGDVTAEEVIDLIFESFCIGK